MKNQFYVILSTLLTILNILDCSKVYDSYLNIYKENKFESHKFEEIANSTWKEFFISENVTNLIKCVPVLIDNDKELDLLILDSESRLYWVSNIRGTSKEVKRQFISDSKLQDFVISTSKISNDNHFILGINSKRDKILIFKMLENQTNFTKFWQESDFLDINDSSLSFIKNSQIVSLHLSEFENDNTIGNKKLLLVGLENYLDYSTSLLKIIISDDKIESTSLIKFKNTIRILGAYDMNKDGLLDVLYVDSMNNLYIMLNDDPYYWHIFVASINTVVVRNIPRVFILDADNDEYPDIITADRTENTVGILFNNGKEYWQSVKDFYQNSQNREKVYSEGHWPFIPLIDVYEEGLGGAKEIRDFTVFQTKTQKRINFEIFAVYEKSLFWFIEKDVQAHGGWGSHKMLQNYMYCMTKCDIVVDQQGVDDSLNYHFILDIDINEDLYPEFIIFSNKDSCLYWIKKYVPYLTGFGWNSNFWIYLIIYIYLISSVLGIWEFYRLKTLNDQISLEKLLKVEEKVEEKPDWKLFSSFIES